MAVIYFAGLEREFKSLSVKILLLHDVLLWVTKTALLPCKLAYFDAVAFDGVGDISFPSIDNVSRCS